LVSIHSQINYGAHFAVFWSLAIEEQFYFFFPVVLRWLRNEKALILFCLSVVFLGCVWRTGIYFFQPSNSNLQILASFGVFDLIAVGILLHLSAKTWKKYLTNHQTVSSLLCFLGLLIGISVYTFTSFDSAIDRIYASLALAFGIYLFLLGGLHLDFFELNHLRPLSWPGKYCYGMYLWHSTIFCWFYPFFLSRTHTFLAFTAIVVLCTVFSSMSYHFFEMPSNRWVRNAFSGEKNASG